MESRYGRPWPICLLGLSPCLRSRLPVCLSASLLAIGSHRVRPSNLLPPTTTTTTTSTTTTIAAAAAATTAASSTTL